MELEQKVRGDWFELTDSSKSLFTLQDYFHFTKPFLESCLSGLQSSVEQGIIEYKRKTFSSVYEFIFSLKYDSKGLEQLDETLPVFKSLLYCIQVQKLIASGVVRSRTKIIEGEREGEPGDMKAIIEDVNERIQKDPSLKMNPYVKNIFLQMQMYRNELGEMKRLAATIPKDKQPGFVQNYKNRFDEIQQKIGQNFLSLLDEQEPVKKEVPAGVWQYDLKPLNPVYEKQSRLASKGVSLFSWAVEEGYKTREALFRILPMKEEFETLFSLELKTFGTVAAGIDGGEALLADFGREFGRILEKQISSFY